MFEVRVYKTVRDAERNENLINSYAKPNKNQAWLVWMKVLKETDNVVDVKKDGVLIHRFQRRPANTKSGYMIKTLYKDGTVCEHNVKIKKETVKKTEEKPEEKTGFKIIVNRNPCQKAEIEDCENL